MIKQQDYQMHIMGAYVLSAVMTGIERNFAQHPKGKYIEKPFLQEAEEREYIKKNDRPEYKDMSEEEKQKAELEKAKAYFNSLLKRF